MTKASATNEAERRAGDADFDYRRLPNADAEFGREETVKEKGFYILPQDLFANVRERARTDENLNETLSRVFTNIEASAVGADSEDDIKGLFADLDVNSGKLGATVAKRNEKLVKLLDAIGDLDFGNDGFTHNTIDAFGDAYEYLMGMYAANAPSPVASTTPPRRSPNSWRGSPWSARPRSTRCTTPRAALAPCCCSSTRCCPEESARASSARRSI